ncbi:MAG: MFS transporter [Chlamydiales bacterium]|nr:MFS transporter [Chlamydiia bacterium]MCP5507136.1 MFS transporter [Chlamydiales bacterium]
MHKKEMSSIYLAGLIQGIVLVAFPAASTLFTNPHYFNFSSTQYGALFISQSILAIASSALSSKISRRLGAKSTYLFGLFANSLSMALFAFSALIIHEELLVYPLLILATTFLGIGFGLTVPTINTMAANLRPKQVDTVILILNALLGIGTVLAPVLISIFIAYGAWWGLPLILVVALALLIAFSTSLTLPGEKTDGTLPSAPLPKKVFIFIAFALFYGYVETLNGNWASIYMRQVQDAPLQMQSLALTIFWATVTVGRIFFACVERYLPSRRVFQGLPIIVMIAFLLLGILPHDNPYLSLCVIGIAGLGCSALLPLTISLGTSQLPSISQSVAGIVVAFYLMGYGIAAFTPGFVLDHSSYQLSNVYSFSSIAAIVLAFLAFYINRGSKANS